MILTHLKVSRTMLEEVSSSLILMPLSMLYNMLLICSGDDLGLRLSLTNSDTHAAATCITGNGSFIAYSFNSLPPQPLTLSSLSH